VRAVVEDQQHLAAADLLGDLLDQPGALQQVQSGGGRDRRQDGGRVVQRGQGHPADAVLEAVRELTADGHREACLAHPAGSGERQQSREALPDQAFGGGELGRAADQLVRRGGWLAHRWPGALGLPASSRRELRAARIVELESVREQAQGVCARRAPTTPLQRRDRVDTQAGKLGQSLLRQPGLTPVPAQQATESCPLHVVRAAASPV
jgi:hypothetical protein